MTFTRTQLLIGTAVLALIIVALAVTFGGSRGFRRGGTLEATVSRAAENLKIQSPVYNPADRSIYFFDYGELKVAKIDSTGKIEHLSGFLSGVEEAIWSPDFTKVLLRNVNDLDINPDSIAVSPLLRGQDPNQAILTWLYDISGKKLTFVSSRYGSVAWTTSNQILYTFGTADGGDISLANPDGTAFNIFTTVVGHFIAEVVAYVPNQGLLYLGGLDHDERSLYFRALNSNQSELIAEGVSRAVFHAGTVVYVPTNDAKRVASYDVSRKTSMDIFKGESAVTDIAFLGNDILIASAEGLSLIDLQEKAQLTLKSEQPLPDVNGIVPGSTEQSFYFTSDNTLYRVDLP